MRQLISLLVLLLLFSGADAFPFTGEVVRILDGDTIEVLHNGKAQRVRLHGIDCPEKGQPFGNNAKQAISSLIFAQEVTLQIYGKDKYRRILADVLLADETNVNHQLVKDGWCWWYRKYAPDNTALEALENEAREEKKGLWIDHDPIPPWEWRKSTR
ncbi:MAG: thermonuclease family protein [Nitrospira sp.]|nr:thermonuclease family protein [Nitrospira sp.]